LGAAITGVEDADPVALDHQALAERQLGQARKVGVAAAMPEVAYALDHSPAPRRHRRDRTQGRASHAEAAGDPSGIARPQGEKEAEDRKVQTAHRIDDDEPLAGRIA